MQYEVDTYKLEFDNKLNKYYIFFKDSVGKECKLEIEEEIFNVYMKSKQEYKKIQNQYDRHEEHFEQTEKNLYKKGVHTAEYVEDFIIKKEAYSDLRKTVKKVTSPHNKRVEMYFFKEMTIQEIATKEGKNERTIRYSIKKGIDEIIKKFKKI